MQAKYSVYDAIAHPARRRILRELSKGAAPAHRLARNFDISQQGVSKHLRILSNAGLTKSARKGRENIYFLNAAPLNEVRDWLKIFWKGKLEGFKAAAEEETNE